MKKFLTMLSLLAIVFTMGLYAAEGPAAEQDAEEISAPAEEVTVDQFKTKLATDGVWIEDADYGWIFKPNVVVADVSWRPYCNDGHWVWTTCGWYWKSDYAWGWACFHYGRWCCHPVHHCWVWIPDTCWGPSWVSWRECDTHWGWAALPPAAHFDLNAGFTFNGGAVGVGFEFGLHVDDFVFVPCGLFLDVHIGQHCCHHDDCVKIYNRTVVRNTYIVKNKTVINNSISVRRVSKETHVAVKQQRVVNRETTKSVRRDRQTERQQQRTERQDHRKVERAPKAQPRHETAPQAPKHEAAPRHAAPAPQAAPRSAPAPHAAPVAPKHEAAPRQAPVAPRTAPAPRHEAPAPHHAPAPQTAPRAAPAAPHAAPAPHTPHKKP